jgi:hypothetical protein
MSRETADRVSGFFPSTEREYIKSSNRATADTIITRIREIGSHHLRAQTRVNRVNDTCTSRCTADTP